MSDRKQIPGLPEAVNLAENDFFVKRDTASGTDQKIAASLIADKTLELGEVTTSTGTQTVAGALDSRVIYVDTIADLQALPVGELVDGQAVYVSADNDGVFVWDASSTAPEYFGLVVASSGSATGRFFRNYNKINLNDVGGSPANTEAQNKTALDDLIAYLDGKAAVIEIDSDIDYGLVRATPATYPDFSSVSDPDTRIAIYDWSLGDADADDPDSRPGTQPRIWYHTGNEEDGQHNGNFEYVYAGWHPGYFINHTGDREVMAAGPMGINRRASVFFGTNDTANWRLGQGRKTGDLTEEELAQFIIAANGLPDLGVEGLTTCFVINKTNGNIGFNVGDPNVPYHMAIRTGQSNVWRLAGDADGGNLRILLEKGNGSSGEIVVRDGNQLRLIAGGASALVAFPNGNVECLKGVSGSTVTSDDRPSGSRPGTMIFDTTLDKPIWFTGSVWVDATGTAV